MESNEQVSLRMRSDLKKRWDVFCAEKRVSQKDAIEAVVEWLVSQDDITQSIILGQLPARHDLAALVIKRMADNTRKHKTAPPGQRSERHIER